MGNFERFCQSCGMPMEKNPAGGGTNADGTISTEYCSYCYTNGKFNDNFTKAGEMAGFVRGKLKEMGIGPLRRWFYTSHISSLKRWKS